MPPMRVDFTPHDFPLEQFSAASSPARRARACSSAMMRFCARRPRCLSPRAQGARARMLRAAAPQYHARARARGRRSTQRQCKARQRKMAVVQAAAAVRWHFLLPRRLISRRSPDDDCERHHHESSHGDITMRAKGPHQLQHEAVSSARRERFRFLQPAYPPSPRHRPHFASPYHADDDGMAAADARTRDAPRDEGAHGI